MNLRKRWRVFSALFMVSILCFTSCDNFLQGTDVKEEITKSIEYNNAPSYAINVEALAGTGAIKTPATGEVTKKVTDTFTIRFEPAENHKFIKWEAVVKGMSTGEKAADYITFEDSESLETKVTFKKASSKTIVLRPVCPEIISVKSFSLGETDKAYPKDSSIILAFNKPIAEDCINSISVSIPGIDEGKDFKDYFKAPKLISEKEVAIYADWDKETGPNYIPIESGGNKIISVTIPKDKIYYTCTDYLDSYKIPLDKDLTYTYTISSETSKKTNIKFLVDTETNGSLRINEESITSLSAAYSVGKKIALKYKPEDEFFFDKWVITYTDENGTVVQKDDTLDEQLKALNLSISYPDNEDTLGVDYTTNTAQAIITVDNYIPGTVTISPVNKPRIKVHFDAGEENEGVLKLDDRTIESQTAQFSVGKTLSLKYKVNEGYKFKGWVFSRTYRNINGIDVTDVIPMESLDVLHIGVIGEDDASIENKADNYVPLQIYVTFNNYVSGTITIKPDVGFIPLSGVTVSGSHGKFSPGKGSYSLREGDSKTISFESDQDYQFIRWEIINSVTKQVIENNEYITIEDIYNENCNYKLTTAPEDDDILMELYPVVVERPQIISATPIYDAIGAYRDARIQVMFDNDMDSESIYYTEPEIAELQQEYNLVDDENETDFLKINLGTAANPVWKYYGYKKDGNIVYKNIQIKDNKTQNNILACFEAPFFEDARTLIIPSSKTNPPAGGTTILVNLDKNFSYLCDGRPVSMRESKKWVYFVNSSTDIVPPVLKNIKILNVVGDEVKNTSAEKVYLREDKKIKIGLSVVDTGSGPTGAFELIFTDGNTQKISIPYESVTGGSAMCGALKSGNQTGFDTYYEYSLSDLTDGDYAFAIRFYDKNGNYCNSTNAAGDTLYYYITVDTVKPNVPKTTMTLQTADDTENSAKTALTLGYSCSDTDFNGGVLSYRPAVALDDEHWDDWSTAEQKTFAKNEKTPLITGLAYGTDYEIKAEFLDNAKNVTTYYFKRRTMPAALDPSKVSVTADQETRAFTVNWTEAPAGIYTGAHITYKTQATNEQIVKFIDSAEPKQYSYTSSSLEYGATYNFTVTSYDIETIVGDIYANNGYQYEERNTVAPVVIPSSSTIITKPRGITNLTIDGRSTGIIKLNFNTPVSTNYTKAKIYYAVYNDDNSIGDYGEPVSINSGTATYSATNLDPGKHYKFKIVTWYNTEANTCADSEIAEISAWTLPAVATNISATTAQTSIALSWAKPAGVKEYYITWQGTGENLKDAIIDGSQTSYNITGLTAGNKYNIYIISRQEDSVDGNCTSGLIQRYTKSAPVTNIRIDTSKTVGQNNIPLAWTKPVDKYSSIALYYGTSSSSINNQLSLSTTELSNCKKDVIGLTPGQMYYFQFRTTSANNEITKSSVFSKSTQGDGVKNLTVTSNTEKSVSLSWQYPSKWKQVQIKYKLSTDPDSDSNWTTATTINYSSSAATSATVLGLNPNKYYNFKVVTTVTLDNGDTTYNQTIDKGTKPNSVTNLTVTSGNYTDAAIQPSWTAPTGGAAGYKVYYKQGSGSWELLNDSCTDTYYNKAGLTAGTQYTFKVVAYSESGEESAEATYERYTRTSRISGLSYSRTSTTISFDWNQPSGNYTGFHLYYRAASSGSWSSLGNSTNRYYTLSTTAGSYYEFKVVTYLSGHSDCDAVEYKTSAYSLPTCATISSITNNIDNMYVYLSYPSQSENWDHVSLYYKKNSDSSSSYSLLKTVYKSDSSKPTYVYKNGLNPNTKYDFDVRTYITNYDWAHPTEKTVSTKLYAPSNLTATQANGGITLSWTAPTGTARSGMRIYYKKSTASSWSTTTTTASETSKLFSASQLDRDSTYSFFVVAYGNLESTATNTITKMTSPAKATNLSVDRDDGQGHVRLTWKNPTSSTFSGVNIYVDDTYTAYVSKSSYGSGAWVYKWINISNPRDYHSIKIRPYNMYDSSEIESDYTFVQYANYNGNFWIDGVEYENTGLANVITSSTTITKNTNKTGGAFTKGRTVTLSPYSIGKFEVTYALWDKVMGFSAPASSVANKPITNQNWFECIAFCNKLSLLMDRTPWYTVSCVSDWSVSKETLDFPYDAKKANYSAWRNASRNTSSTTGYHLPSEMEWEFAARGGNTSNAQWGYTYSGSNSASAVANFDGAVANVGSKTSNRLGLYDMSGNVWEWLTDWNNTVPDGTYTNYYFMNYDYVHDQSWGRANDGLVLKGGSYLTTNSDNKDIVYNSYKEQPYTYRTDVGLRICCQKTY